MDLSWQSQLVDDRHSIQIMGGNSSKEKNVLLKIYNFFIVRTVK